MHTSARGLDLIKQYEGFSARAYLCPAGKLTIGYGHVIKPGEEFPASLSVEEAENLLRADLAIAENALERLVKVPLSQNQWDALVSFIYNVGATAFEKSTLLRKINKKNWKTVQAQFPRLVYANGSKINGLMNRRLAEAALFQEEG